MGGGVRFRNKSDMWVTSQKTKKKTPDPSVD